jgi:hypothetical protein
MSLKYARWRATETGVSEASMARAIAGSSGTLAG